MSLRPSKALQNTQVAGRSQRFTIICESEKEEAPGSGASFEGEEKGNGHLITPFSILCIGNPGEKLMAEIEEFEVTIDRDGRIRLDFRGMSESSYRRIVEVLQETVGPVERLDLEAGGDEPPAVREYHEEKEKKKKKKEAQIKNGRRR